MSHARSKVTNTAHAAVPWHANWCAMWVSITALLARAGSADDRSSPPSRRRERPSVRITFAPAESHSARWNSHALHPLDGKDSPNAGWRNEAFRGFADYLQT